MTATLVDSYVLPDFLTAQNHDCPAYRRAQGAHLAGASASRAGARTFDLAQAHGPTIYDAAYLELALRAGLKLATLDGALGRAALAVGLPAAF